MFNNRNNELFYAYHESMDSVGEAYKKQNTTYASPDNSLQEYYVCKS